jgi:hypothetical protein
LSIFTAITLRSSLRVSSEGSPFRGEENPDGKVVTVVSGPSVVVVAAVVVVVVGAVLVVVGAVVVGGLVVVVAASPPPQADVARANARQQVRIRGKRVMAVGHSSDGREL